MRTLLTSSFRALPFVLMLLPTLGACSAPSAGADEDPTVIASDDALTASRRVFVGGMRATDARVGIVVEEGRIAVFVCGGPTTVGTHTRWFRGTLPAGAREVRLTASDWSVGLWREGDHLAGALDRGDGYPLAFSVREVASPYLGLYTTRIENATVGVIVSDDDGDGRLEVQGAVQAIQASSGLTFAAQVTPVRIASLAPPALVVRMPLEGMLREAVVRPLELSTP